MCEECKTYYSIIEFENNYERETHWAHYFRYTLHELPIGVLIDANGAGIDDCNELLEILAEYEVLCKELGVNRDSLIFECRYYYNAYKKYLSVFKEYNGFEDYLNKNK